MRLSRLLAGSATAAALALAASPAAFAQQITTDVNGIVTDEAGSAISGATVTVIDTRTNAARTIATNDAGRFSARNLNTGGPYTITVTATNFQGQSVEGVFTNLSGDTTLNFTLLPVSDTRTLDTVVVTSSQVQLQQLAIGPSSSFNLETIENFPSIARDIRDIIRFDPRVVIDGGNDDNISCLGGNNRFNSFTVDGVRTNDAFGLNASGFPNRNTLPIPFDSIRETSVEFAPYDVTLGEFTGCNINVVTKAGTNKWSGAAFVVYNNDALTGDDLPIVSGADPDIVRSGDFDDYNWGASLSGPIIKDKLFFSFFYEEVSDGGGISTVGPAELGFANPITAPLSEIEQISAILASEYGFDTGGIATTLPETNRRFLGRLDWQINDQHRAEFTYSRLDEANTEPDDLFGDIDFIFANTFEIEGTEQDAYSFRFFSDWTDNFSTDIRYSRNNVQDLQGPVGGGEAQDPNPIPRFEIVTSTGEIVLNGPGQFRSANDLRTTRDQFRLKGDYQLNNHKITVGYELDRIDVFNLFAVNATGTFRFASVDDLQNRIVTARGPFDPAIEANGSFSGDITDAGATFVRNIHTLYAQDEWAVTPDLTLTAGVRYDFYRSDDAPTESQSFVDRYGFSNSTGFDGLDAFQPRIALQYQAPEKYFGDTNFRAGWGLFSGGDPTVWFSNSFSNFGGGIGFGETFGAGCTDADLTVLGASGTFGGLPQCVINQQQAEANAGLGRIDAIDPNFNVPRVWRANFGFTHLTDFQGFAGGFFDDWTLGFDAIFSQTIDGADFVDLTLTPIGTAPDGRNVFNAVNPLLPGCDATFVGPRVGFQGPAEQLAQGGACDAGRDDQDILLTNVAGPEGFSNSISFQLNKSFDYQLFNSPGSFRFNFGYAYSDVEDVNPTTSSTATSNFEEVAIANLNNPVLSPGQFFNEHNLTLQAGFQQEFFDGFVSRLNIAYTAQSGRRFSFTFDGDTGEDFFGDTDDEERILFYVPTGVNDPLVNFAPGFDTDAFFAFLEDNGLNEFAGQISPRNAFEAPWFHDIDLRFSQEFPIPAPFEVFEDQRIEFFMDIENFLNLLSASGNVRRDPDNGAVGEAVPVVIASISDDGSTYTFESFNAGGESFGFDGSNTNRNIDIFNDPVLRSSLWAIQFGLRYEF